MVSQADIRKAMATLGVNSSSAETDPLTLSEQRVKAAFRAKALEWHPDCNPDPEAEDTFKRILLAYELLLAHAR
ncbi:hypothetical protein BBJ28_00002444 [Nothophytophthora sp. Chile5]|nr:hypothetical protein BBJ28_00002444 [Nothophytophthora sp. Chile5]